jgi:hypothetical protein
VKKFVFATLLGAALLTGASALGGATPAMAQGKIFEGPGRPGYGSAARPYRPGFRRGYVAPRPFGYRRGYGGPRRGDGYGPRRYNRY